MKIFKNHLTKSQAIELFKKVKSQVHPDITDLKYLVGFHKAPVGPTNELQALDLKYQAMAYVPTVIEKTMTQAQLYDAGSPSWCIEYSIKQLTYYFELDHEFLTGESVIRYINDSINRKSTEPYIPWDTLMDKLSPTYIMSHQIISGFASPRKKSTK